MAIPIPDWVKNAPLLDPARMEIGFHLKPDFYYGPDTLEGLDRREQIEPLPSVAKEPGDSFLPLEEALHHLDALDRYYREILRLAAKHDIKLRNISSYFWLDLRIVSPPSPIVIPFPWHETAGEIASILEEFMDSWMGESVTPWVEQGWQLEIFADKEFFYIRHSCFDTGALYSTAKFRRGPLALSAKQSRHDLIRLIEELSRRVGGDYWTDHFPYDGP